MTGDGGQAMARALKQADIGIANGKEREPKAAKASR